MATDTPIIRLAGPFKCGPVSGMIREMKRGDKFPLHVHAVEHLNHLTVILRGSLRCFGRPAIDGAVVVAGDVIDWVVGEPHGLEALEDGTRVMQIRKGP